MPSQNQFVRLTVSVQFTNRLLEEWRISTRRLQCIICCGLVFALTNTAAQLPFRDAPTILDVTVEGRPLREELGGSTTASGAGLWLRNDTLFSARFAGVERYIAFKLIANDEWKPYSLAIVPINITSSAVSADGQYIALGYEGGSIEISTDGGQSFLAVESPTQHNVNAIAVNSKGSVAFGRVPEGDLFVSSDHGTTWIREELPKLINDSTYHALHGLKFDTHDILSFVTAVIPQAGQHVLKVFFRRQEAEWKSVEVANASRAFFTDSSSLYVSTLKRIPGRVDDTGFTELVKVDTRTGQIDTAFSFVKEDDLSTISSVWASTRHRLTMATTSSSLYSLIGTAWYQERVQLPSYGPMRLFVEISNSDVYAVAGTHVIRMRLSPVLSVPRYIAVPDDSGAVLKDGRLASGSVVYDILGRVVHINYAHEPAFWQPPTSGMYFVVDLKTGRVLSRVY